MNESERIVKILCPSCGRQTNHKIVWSFKGERNEDEESGMWEKTDYDLLQCLGCETPTLRKEYMFSEDLDMRNVNGEWVVYPNVTFWPKTGYRMIKPKYLYSVPANIKRIYGETIDAYNSELQTLCSAGVRAIIELSCKDLGIKGNNLKDKINSLKEKGVITEALSEALHENRLLGNDALHEFTLFGDTELKTSIELIETFIEMVYETERKIKLLKSLRESKKQNLKK